MGGLFSRPKVRTPEPEPPAPIPDQPEIERARRRALSRQRGRTGRQATRLTEGAATGGREFARTTLG